MRSAATGFPVVRAQSIAVAPTTTSDGQLGVQRTRRLSIVSLPPAETGPPDPASADRNAFQSGASLD